ncbi:MAG: DUF4349 domain-containing protein [Polyangiaceae bacterium]
MNANSSTASFTASEHAHSALTSQRFTRWFAALLALSMIVGGAACSKRDEPSRAHAAAEARPASPTMAHDVLKTEDARSPSNSPVTPAAAPVSDRKVIRNAELTVEANDPREAARILGNLAERHSGFLASSDSQQSGPSNDPTAVSVTLVMRVPSAEFATTLDEIRASGSKVLHERISGQDVTDEFVDVEARLRSYKALEAQLHELLRDAKTVSDAIQVHAKLNETRTEIERLEGRRRVLEDKTSLSTFTVRVQKVAPLVTASSDGIATSFRKALGDGVDTSAAIVTGAIRLTGVLLPVMLLIFLPMGLLLRWAIRFVQRRASTSAARAAS